MVCLSSTHAKPISGPITRRDQVGKNQRLLEKLCDERESGCDYKDEADIGEQAMLIHTVILI
jgi:hypothetical protein